MGSLDPKDLTFLTFPYFKHFWKKKNFNISRVSWVYLSETGEMLNVFFRQVLKTGEMLNMLNMLNRWGEMGPLATQNLTYLTFPLF